MMKSTLNRTVRAVCCAVLLFTAGTATASEEATRLIDPAEALKGVKILDLQTAARISLAGNPSLAAAQARVMQARQLVKQAQAPYYPQLDARAGYSRVDLSDNAYLDQRTSYDLMTGL